MNTNQKIELFLNEANAKNQTVNSDNYLHVWELSTYNSGYHLGLYVDLDLCDSEQDVIATITEWLDELQERVEELGLTDYFNCEEWIEGDLQNEFNCELSEFFEYKDLDFDADVIKAAIDLGIPAESVQDAFCCDLSDELNINEAFGYYLIDELNCLEIPENIQFYFDYEAYGRDALISDFSEIDGIVFWSHY